MSITITIRSTASRHPQSIIIILLFISSHSHLQHVVIHFGRFECPRRNFRPTQTLSLVARPSSDTRPYIVRFASGPIPLHAVSCRSYAVVILKQKLVFMRMHSACDMHIIELNACTAHIRLQNGLLVSDLHWRKEENENN